MNIAPDNIVSLKPNEVFIFGSNEAGIHGSGAAKTALQWGAVIGEGVGHYGQTYAIPTKDFYIQTLNLDIINEYVKDFIGYAKMHPELIFLVTRIGCGLAGYESKDIAPMFAEAARLPNIWLPNSFWELLNE